MPLRDHFRSPVNNRHAWNELYGGWPSQIVRSLFDHLPDGYRSAPTVHRVQTFETDVAAMETDLPDQDEFEVRVYDAERGRRLVAAIELVSPANKDRPEHRRSFVAKCAALLRQDVSVSIVDVVTERHANLYADLLDFLGETDPSLNGSPPNIYAVTLRSRYRPSKRSLLDTWVYPFAIGEKLPSLPLWLTETLSVPLDLESSYEETCRLLRIR